MTTSTGQDLADRATDLVERVRASETAERAQAMGQQVAHELAERLRDLPVEEWAAQLGAWLNEAAQALRSHPVTSRARRRTGAALERLGDALARQQPRRIPKGRRMPWWAVLVGGFAAGFAVAGVLSRRRARAVDSDAYVASAQKLVDQAATRASERATATVAFVDEIHPRVGSLADRVRAGLAADPRTASLGELEVNVAEGVVFIRGAVPAASDEAAIRDVITTLDGVSDIDLQVVVQVQ